MYFSDSYELRQLEKLMRAIPNFRPRGHGVVILHRYEYTEKDCDCRACPHHISRKKGCGADKCPCINERITTGAATLKEAVAEAMVAIQYHPRPEDYDISDYCERVFMMYEGKPCKVKLLCDNRLMKAIIDRFGEDVETHIHDDNSFSVVAEISASSTFYSWVFTYGGKMKIVEPKSIRDEYERRLNEALKNR